MTRTKKFFYSSLTTALLQMVNMIAGFITPKFMLRFYGSDINGLVSSVNQFIVYFNLVEAGLSGAAIYALYKPLADNDHKAINGVVVAAKKFYTQSGYIFISLTIGLSVIYPVFVKSDAVSPVTVGLLVLILGVNGALEFFTLAKYRVLLSADQRTYIISMATIVHVIVNTVIVAVLSSWRVNIAVLRLVALFSIFLRSAILMVYVKIKYKYINYAEKPNFGAMNKRWDVLYLQVLEAINTGAPIVILTIVTRNLKLVSVYTIFNIVIAGLNGILSIFKSGLPASFGDIIVRGEEKTLQKAYTEFEYTYYSLITIIYSVAFITNMPFIRIYTKGVTDINYDLPLIGFLFVLNGFLYNIKNPQGMLVISAGLYKETKIQTTIQGAIVVIAGAALAPFLGVAGVLIGSILSNLYRNIDLLFFIPKYVTKLPPKNTAYRIFRTIGAILIVWVPFMFIKINPAGYISWAENAAAIGIFAILVTAASGFLFERSTMLNTVKRILRMAKRW